MVLDGVFPDGQFSAANAKPWVCLRRSLHTGQGQGRRKLRTIVLEEFENRIQEAGYLAVRLDLRPRIWPVFKETLIVIDASNNPHRWVADIGAAFLI